MSNSFDLIVIGAGPGGYPAAIRASQLGLKVACIEKEKVGGVCLNWGCVPSKALLKSAELANKLSHAEDFGIKAGPVEIAFDAVIGRARKVSQRFEKGVSGLFKKYKVNHIQGTAKLLSSTEVEVISGDETTTYTAKNIVVATGARARTFPGIEADGERLLTYRHAIFHEDQPKSVTILGSGAIGLEFAYFWNAMGAEVTVVEGLQEILPREDVEIAKIARREMEKQGITFKLGSFVKEARRKGDSTETELQDGTVLTADYTLIALGISPNSEGIGLDEVGVNTDRGFITIDAFGRTNVPGVFAVGDVSTKGGLAHTATAQGHAVADLIAGHHVVPVNYDAIPSCTYCQPQVASVGLTEAEAKAQGKAFKVGRFPFVANAKAWGAGHPEGLVKVLVGEEYGEILGAHIVGSEATEMIAEFGLAVSSELTTDELLHTVHAHPTHSEAMFEAVAQALGESVHI